MLRNFRIPDPARTEISPDTITLLDIVDLMGAMQADLGRFEQTSESRYAGITCNSIDKVIKAWEDLKKGIRGEQHRINERHRIGAAKRKAELEAQPEGYRFRIVYPAIQRK
jgi:hypothetical protein